MQTTHAWKYLSRLNYKAPLIESTIKLSNHFRNLFEKLRPMYTCSFVNRISFSFDQILDLAFLFLLFKYGFYLIFV
jgi:hypothetical protein